MGRNLKGKELGTGISQRKDGKFVGQFTIRLGKGQKVKIFEVNNSIKNKSML